jgi:hypothetical protein
VQPVWDDDELLLRSVPGKLMHIPRAANEK